MLDGLLHGYELDAPAALLQRPLDATVGVEARRADVLDIMEARNLPLVPIVDCDGRLAGVHLRDELIGPSTLDNWAVIMAGGRGTRLAPLTDTIPKPMLPVAGRPILERLVLHLVGAGIRTIFLSVNYRREQIEEHFGNGADFGCSIQYLVEDSDQPLGSGGALSLLTERRWFPTRPLLVLNGDLVVDFSVTDLLAAHARENVAATMVVHPFRYQVPYGVVQADDQRLTCLVEKPVTSWLVNTGIYVLEPGLISRIPAGEPFPITTLFEECLEHGDRVGVFEIEDWQDVGQPAELLRARGMA
ncbi:MAG TPA: nucleotidyltransferase family protein [Euzebyales bacterium]|nr:nucleotidyltransferase family protein [Euzebyales bacterium]